MVAVSIAILAIIAVRRRDGRRCYRLTMDILILVGAFVVILVGAELFTNGIEWFGRKLELAEGAVGSVLAAVGTALPETMIPIIAILFATGESSNEVGVGAILGAPFMLATLAMFVTGVAVLAVARQSRHRRRDAGRHRRPGPRHALLRDRLRAGHRRGLPAGRAGLAEMDRGRGAHRDLCLVRQGPFRGGPGRGRSRTSRRCASIAWTGTAIRRSDVPRLRVVNLQVIAALGLIILGAVFFVDAVEHLATEFGIDGALLALVIAPIATELPEKFNSIIWVRQGKHTLAMGNITGAMVFQSTIPTVVALVFASDSWVAAPGSYVAFASAGIAFLSSASSSSRWPVEASCADAGCSSAACSTWPTWASSSASSAAPWAEFGRS